MASCRYGITSLQPLAVVAPSKRLQEDSSNVLHIITAILFVDGRQNDGTFELMGQEGCFPRLVELIRGRRDDDGWLHRRLLELLYEMSRIQRIRSEDLSECSWRIVLEWCGLTVGQVVSMMLSWRISFRSSSRYPTTSMIRITTRSYAY